MITCVRIGFGKIARIHEDHLRIHGVKTIGVVERNQILLKEIEQSGLRAFDSLHEAVLCKPDFYDVCVPASARLDVLRVLCQLDPHANILIEKPVCDFDHIDEIRNILFKHSGRVAVNENYASSNVTKRVQNEVSERKLTPTRLIVESTKHRGKDFLAGRYLDNRLGAIGYEGSHLLAIISEFGGGYEANRLLDSDLDNMHLSVTAPIAPADNQLTSDNQLLKTSLSNQGGAYMQYRANNGCIVDLYTSMSGYIGFPCPPFAYPGQKIDQDDALTRYRMLRVDGLDANGVSHQIIGFYEPVAGLARSQGKLLIFKNWVLDEVHDSFEDNTMSQHLLRVIRYFGGLEENPYEVKRALTDVLNLNKWAHAIQADSDDSDDVLGLQESANARLEDAKRFKMMRH